MYLTTEQRVFLVQKYLRTHSLQDVANAFAERFQTEPLQQNAQYGKTYKHIYRQAPVSSLRMIWSFPYMHELRITLKRINNILKPILQTTVVE